MYGLLSRHNIFRKGDTPIEIVRMCIDWGFIENDVFRLYRYIEIT